jgi:hypothetical protein
MPPSIFSELFAMSLPVVIRTVTNRLKFSKELLQVLRNHQAIAHLMQHQHVGLSITQEGEEWRLRGFEVPENTTISIMPTEGWVLKETPHHIVPAEAHYYWPQQREIAVVDRFIFPRGVTPTYLFDRLFQFGPEIHNAIPTLIPLTPQPEAAHG